MIYVRVLQDQIVRATDKHEYKEVYDLQIKLVQVLKVKLWLLKMLTLVLEFRN